MTGKQEIDYRVQLTVDTTERSNSCPHVFMSKTLNVNYH